MEIIAVQFDIEWENKTGNFNKIEKLLSNNTISKDSLIILPEMFATGFSMNNQSNCEDENGPAHGFMQSIARKYSSFIIGGVGCKQGGHFYNNTVVFDPDGKILTQYSKIHPFSYGRENEFYQPGDNIVTFQWNQFQVAPFICYDLRFPEVFRHATLKGAEIFVVIANWPITREHHWVNLLYARAIENQSYIIGLNRIGATRTQRYNGKTLIIDPKGEILAAGTDQEMLVRATPNKKLLETYRKEFPALKDIKQKYLGLNNP
jgi:predicted amidohydrolase